MTETIRIEHKDFPQLTARRFGSGAQAIVLLHGFPADGRLWEEVVPVLGRDCTVVVPDFPGTGGSRLPEGDLSMEIMAGAVKVVLESQGIGEVVVAGHSMGGYAALAFAALYPRDVKGLSMVHSTAKADTEEKKEQRRKAIALIRKGGKEAFVKQMIPGLFSSDTRAQRPELLQRLTERALELPDESLVKFYEAMIIRPDRTEMLSSAAFPVQWVLGKEDTAVPLQSGLAQTSLTEVAFVSVYEHTGHMSMLERPEKLAADLERFTQYCYNR